MFDPTHDARVRSEAGQSCFFMRKPETLVRLDVHPHAFQRMGERGASREEVLRTIGTGRVSPARFGRQRCGMTFSFGNYWRAQLYEHKHIEAYCVVDGEDIIVGLRLFFADTVIQACF